MDGLFDGINLGIGKGYSVCDVVDIVKCVLGCDFLVEECLCCVGDLVKLVVDVCCVWDVLNWQVECSEFEMIVEDVWWFFSVCVQGQVSLVVILVLNCKVMCVLY